MGPSVLVEIYNCSPELAVSNAVVDAAREIPFFKPNMNMVLISLEDAAQQAKDYIALPMAPC